MMPTALGTVASHRTVTTGPIAVPVDGSAGWRDATDASTFTFTTGAQFSQWRDKSRNVLHMAPEYGANANLVRSGDINGHVAGSTRRRTTQGRCTDRRSTR